MILLKRKLHHRQWIALLLLMLGLALVQITGKENTPTMGGQNKLVGLYSVLAACLSSGYAGVFYEKLVKDSNQPSIIIRNLQLGKSSNEYLHVLIFMDDLFYLLPISKHKNFNLKA